MKVIELKFLLKLLGQENYQGKLNQLKPSSGTSISATEGIFRSLCDRELVACSETITKIKSTSAGKALLKLDALDLPIDGDELKIIKACEQKNYYPWQN